MVERTQTTIRLPVQLKEQLQQEADKRGVSFNEMVNMLLFDGLKISRQKIKS